MTIHSLSAADLRIESAEPPRKAFMFKRDSGKSLSDRIGEWRSKRKLDEKCGHVPRSKGKAPDRSVGAATQAPAARVRSASEEPRGSLGRFSDMEEFQRRISEVPMSWAAVPGASTARPYGQRRASDGFQRDFSSQLSSAQRSLESFLQLESTRGLKVQAAPALVPKVGSIPDLRPTSGGGLRRSIPSQGASGHASHDEMNVGLQENLEDDDYVGESSGLLPGQEDGNNGNYRPPEADIRSIARRWKIKLRGIRLLFRFHRQAKSTKASQPFNNGRSHRKGSEPLPPTSDLEKSNQHETFIGPPKAINDRHHRNMKSTGWMLSCCTTNADG